MMKSIRDFPTIEEAAKKLTQVSARETERTLLERETEIEGFRFHGEQDNEGTWYWFRKDEGDAVIATPFWEGHTVLPIAWTDTDGNFSARDRKQIPLDLTPEIYIEAVREFIEENINGA